MQETCFRPQVRKILGRKKWLPSPAFLPGKSYGQRSLVRLQSIRLKWVITQQHTPRCMYVNPNLPVRPTLPFPTLSTCLLSKSASLSYPANKFICAIFLFHVYALIYNICFSLSDLLHSVWHTPASFTSPQMTQFCAFYAWVIFHCKNEVP